jgi:hypothetical protein
VNVAPPTPAARTARAPQPAAKDTSTGAADGGDSEQALAARTAAFNLLAKEQAEDEREREALEQLVQAQLKFEDEIMKKWIEMI